VVVWGPDYACCGVPFGVGDEVGFSLRAVPGGGDGGGGGAEDGPTYFDDRHPMDPDDSPVDVRGRVEAIVAVHQRLPQPQALIAGAAQSPPPSSFRS